MARTAPERPHKHIANVSPQQITGNAVDDPAHFRTHLAPFIFDRLFDFYSIARFHSIGMTILHFLAVTFSSKDIPLAHSEGQSNTSSLILSKCIPTSQGLAGSVEAHTDPGTLVILFNPPPSLHLFRPADRQIPKSKPRYIPIRPPNDCAVVVVGDALDILTRGLCKAAQLSMISARGMQDVEEWHSVAYRLGPDEKATLVDTERVRWTAADWHAARMGVEGDETM